MLPIRFALILAGLVAMASAAQAQQEWSSFGRTPRGGSSRQDAAGMTHYYDARGSRVGSSQPTGNGRTTNLYGAGGRRSGTSDTDAAGYTTTRDARGQVTGGSRVDAGGRTIYYDAQGRMITR